MEDYAIILDYLPLGYVKEGSNSYKRKPVAQAIGTEEFTLLELTPKENVNLDIHEKVYIGAGKRDQIARVNRRLPFNKMTSTARIEVNYVIEEIIKEKEDKFIQFFNEAGPISTRLHQIELLPGIGKKHMWDIIEARKEAPFQDFADVKKRVPMLSDPVKLIAKRIHLELEAAEDRKGKKKYILFTRPPKRKI
ncbi:MAG: putative RNA-binding protein [Methanobacterium sp. Maddingley MBC34]|nr:MAG: putative RNA-binding protein [Methanobacterium sp. Maddingley MBC34]